MPRQHARIRIGQGMYRDGDGLIAEVRIGSSRDGTQVRLRDRFPLDTPVAEMRTWQHLIRHDLGVGVLDAAAVKELGTQLAAVIAARHAREKN